MSSLRELALQKEWLTDWLTDRRTNHKSSLRLKAGIQKTNNRTIWHILLTNFKLRVYKNHDQERNSVFVGRTNFNIRIYIWKNYTIKDNLSWKRKMLRMLSSAHLSSGLIPSRHTKSLGCLHNVPISSQCPGPIRDYFGMNSKHNFFM